MRKLSQINETSWGGMVRRSNPEKQVRKEDDIDTFGKDDLLQYLSKKYEDEFILEDGAGCIVFKTEDMNILGYIAFKDKYNRPIDNISKFWLDMNIPRRDFEKRILDEFEEINKGVEDDGSQLVSITPKDGELTNRSCIRILDIIKKYRER